MLFDDLHTLIFLALISRLICTIFFAVDSVKEGKAKMMPSGRFGPLNSRTVTDPILALISYDPELCS